MIKLATVSQIKEIEAAADSAGTSYSEMMQRAGRAAADRALTYIEHLANPRVLILIGPGNNGGDGLVTGLFIAQDRSDADVRFYLLKQRPEDDPLLPMTEAAGLFSAIAEHDHDKRLVKNMVASADLVIDALLGIGVNLPLRDDLAKLLRAVKQAVNEQNRERPQIYTVDAAATHQIKRPAPIRIIAIDTPSGINPDTGEMDPLTLNVDETITFIAAKPGLLSFPAAERVGKLSFANIGLPQKIEALDSIQDFVPDADYLASILPERVLDSNKGSHGKALIVGGSVNYMGAPALAAEAAYRSGVGLVTVAAPRPVASALAIQLREPTWLLLPHDMGVIASAAVNLLRAEFNKYTAMLIGPGITTEKAPQDFMEELLSQAQKSENKPARKKIGFQSPSSISQPLDAENAYSLPPLVLDADALNILSENKTLLGLLPQNSILTPHPGEMARLCDKSVAEVQQNRTTLTRQMAAEWGCIVVLKGAHTLVAKPDGEIAIMPFKNPALASAGTGDILAGMITAMLAQGLKAFEAAVAGTYLHGIAGAFASEGANEAILASDMLPYIRKAMIAVKN